MEVRRFADATALEGRAAPFLLAREAEHCLLLGLLAGLRQGRPGAYLAAVEDGGAVVAVALRTSERHNLVLSQVAAPGALDALADDLHRDGVALHGVHGPVPASDDFAARWQHRGGPPARRFMAQRLYRLTRVRPVGGVPGALRPVTTADRALIADWIVAFHREAEGGTEPTRAAEIIDARLASPGGGFALWWHDGRPVSLVGHAGPTAGGIRIGPVYTPPASRGRGYASAAVAALSQQLLDGGRRFCCLFTDLANPTSNRIYRAIGYEPVCDMAEYRFAPG